MDLKNISASFPPLPKDGELGEPAAFQFLTILFYCFLTILIFIIGTVYNCMLLIAFKRSRKLKTPTNYLIVSLAVADLIVCSLVLTLAAYQELDDQFRFGNLLCKIWIGLSSFACVVSIWHICFVAIDRYISITYHLWYKKQPKFIFALKLTLMAWIISFLITILPVFFFGGLSERDSSGYCFLNTDVLFAAFVDLFAFLIPTLITLILNGLTGKSVLGLQRRVTTEPQNQNMLRPNPNRKGETSRTISTLENAEATNEMRAASFPRGGSLGCSERQKARVQLGSSLQDGRLKIDKSDYKGQYLTVPSVSNRLICQPWRMDSIQFDNQRTHQAAEGQLPAKLWRESKDLRPGNSANVKNSHARQIPVASERRSTRNETRERKAVLVLGLITVVFIICWSPFYICHTTTAICKTCWLTVTSSVYKTAEWLAAFNSLINPFVYTIFNTDFRQAIKQIFFRPRPRHSVN